MARNVEEDESAYRDLMTLGIHTVPVTVIGRQIIRGYDPVQLRKALAAGGAESSPDL